MNWHMKRVTDRHPEAGVIPLPLGYDPDVPSGSWRAEGGRIFVHCPHCAPRAVAALNAAIAEPGGEP